MSDDSELFALAADRLAITQKALLALLTAAIVFAVADLLAGRQAKLELNAELQRQKVFTLQAEDVTRRLRFVLSHLYPERSLNERQRLVHLIGDIRRLRRQIESATGAEATLMNYPDSVLPLTEGPVSRLTLNKALSRPRVLAYFKGPEPGGDSYSYGSYPFLDVGINDISTEMSVSQQPVTHVALLLIASLAVPDQMADVLERFARSAQAPRLEHVVALQESMHKVGERGTQLNQAFSYSGKTMEESADALLSSFVRRPLSTDPHLPEDTAVLAAKYASPSLDALSQLLVELESRYLSESARARGERPMQIPGSTVRLPGFLFLLGLPILLLVLTFVKVWLVLQGRMSKPPRNLSLRAAEIKYGYLILRLLGVKAERGSVIAFGQAAIIAFGPLVLSVPVALARGNWTYWISIPFALLVLMTEAWLVKRAMSNMLLAPWPEQRSIWSYPV